MDKGYIARMTGVPYTSVHRTDRTPDYVEPRKCDHCGALVDYRTETAKYGAICNACWFELHERKDGGE